MRAVFLSFALLMLGGKAASAYGLPHADLACAPQRNIALARFAETGEETEKPAFEQLPATMDGGLSKEMQTGRRDCMLANGWRIRLRNGRGQAFAYGMGGGAPGSFFSLWVEGRKIISRRVWTGYDYSEELKPIVAVVISPTGLTICEGTGKARACKTSPLHLGLQPIDKAEYPGSVVTSKATTRSQLAVTGTNPMLCQKLIKRGPDEDRVAMEWNSAEQEPDLPIDSARTEWIDERILDKELDEKWTQTLGTKEMFGIGNEDFGFRVALNQNFHGNNVAIMRHSTNRYFDGSFIVAAPKGTPVIDILRTMYDGNSDEEGAIIRATDRGWAVFSGGKPGIYPNVSPRYVSVRSLEGYLYFQPLNREHRPSLVVAAVGIDGKPSPVCQIQRRVLHY